MLGFETELAARKIEFEHTDKEPPQSLVLNRKQGSPLQVQVAHPALAVSQLLVVAAFPEHPLELVKKEMDQVSTSFEANWRTPRQIVKRDATLRYLFVTDQQHAFQYLWEERLDQSNEAFSDLGGPVLGGGLRLVMPAGQDRKHQIEIKIESFLKDTTQLFMEVQFVWPEPETPGTEMKPMELVDQVSTYAMGSALKFASQSQEGRDD